MNRQISIRTDTNLHVNMDASAIIQHHSRSFSIASRLLPKWCRASVHALYAWCRTVDDAVDSATCFESAKETLQILSDDLDRMRIGLDEVHPASVWIRPLIIERRIDVKNAKELIVGMQMDLQSFRVATAADLRRYCYHAAGTVGLMMARLMGAQDPAANRHAIALGIAMQMTNIARDVREDAERSRAYLPGIADPLTADPQDVKKNVAQILADAEQEYQLATEGLKYLRWDCRLAIRIALALYREIGRDIKRNGYPVLQGRTVLSKPRVWWVLATALLTSLTENLKIAFNGVPHFILEKAMNKRTMNDIAMKDAALSASPLSPPSTVHQSKHAVYLGLSLTLFMASALFVMVFVNPKMRPIPIYL